MNQNERADLERLLSFGRRIVASAPHEIRPLNLSSRVAIRPYLRLVRDMKRILPTGSVLDWGSGWGHNSYLLARAGYQTSAMDITRRFHSFDSSLYADAGVPFTFSKHSSEIPFPEASFDALLSCGTLEHVEDERKSLSEVSRVLRPGGQFFIYFLPHRYSIVEWVSRKTGRYHHSRTYGRSDAIRLLGDHGLETLSMKPYHLLPRNFLAEQTGSASALDHLSGFYDALDRTISFLPPGRWVVTAWKMRAVRR